MVSHAMLLLEQHDNGKVLLQQQRVVCGEIPP